MRYQLQEDMHTRPEYKAPTKAEIEMLREYTPSKMADVAEALGLRTSQRELYQK